MSSDFDPCEPEEQKLTPEAILHSLDNALSTGMTYDEWAQENPELDYRIRLLGTPEDQDMRLNAELNFAISAGSL